MCHANDETIFHALIGCSELAMAWQSAGLADWICTETNYGIWFEERMQTESTRNICQAIFLMYSIWLARNRRMWEGISTTTTEIWRTAERSWVDWQQMKSGEIQYHSCESQQKLSSTCVVAFPQLSPEPSREMRGAFSPDLSLIWHESRTEDTVMNSENDIKIICVVRVISGHGGCRLCGQFVKLASGDTLVDARTDLLGNKHRVTVVGAESIAQFLKPSGDLVKVHSLLTPISLDHIHLSDQDFCQTPLIQKVQTRIGSSGRS
nr:uncharacterized protein LOC105635962 [Ipomoea batatas]